MSFDLESLESAIDELTCGANRNLMANGTGSKVHPSQAVAAWNAE
jgi:hypothetical protein